MTKPSVQGKPNPSSSLSAAWPPFARQLAAVLEALDEDQFLILSAKRSNRFVQFAAQGSFGMRMETTSNSYLAKADQLDLRQISALADLGWKVPTGTPVESTPEADPDGSPNFFVEFPVPVSFAAVADLAVRTISEILRLPHPGSLEYMAFDEERGAMELPRLGLRLAKRENKAESGEDSSQLLLDALKKLTGITELTIDAEGDIGIGYGSTFVLVRLVDNPPHVRFYSRMLIEVEESPELFARLNDINANEVFIRFVFLNGSIFATVNIYAAPFVRAHVTEAFVHFCAIAEGMDSLLQEEFGGQTAFPESMPSSMKH